jgi:hypothetical protein
MNEILIRGGDDGPTGIFRGKESGQAGTASDFGFRNCSMPLPQTRVFLFLGITDERAATVYRRWRKAGHVPGSLNALR